MGSARKTCFAAVPRARAYNGEAQIVRLRALAFVSSAFASSHEGGRRKIRQGAVVEGGEEMRQEGSPLRSGRGAERLEGIVRHGARH